MRLHFKRIEHLRRVLTEFYESPVVIFKSGYGPRIMCDGKQLPLRIESVRKDDFDTYIITIQDIDNLERIEEIAVRQNIPLRRLDT